MKNIGLLIFIFMISFIAQNLPATAENISILTGPAVGTYAKIGENLKEACDGLNIKVYNSPGSMNNVEKLLSEPDKINFGLIQLDVLQILKKTNPDAAVGDIQIVVPLYYEEIHLFASVESGINELADLDGKRVNVGQETSGTRITTIVIKLLYEIDWKESKMPVDEAFDQLLINKIDAFFYVIGMPVPVFKELGEWYSKKIKLVDITNDALKEYYLPAEIPAGTYPWQPNDVKTFKVPSVLATNKNVPESKVVKLVSCLKEKYSYLKKKKHKKWKEVDIRDFSNIKWEVHPAAKKMLK